MILHSLPALRFVSPPAGGLERVRRSRALRCFVPIFSSKQYVKALQGEGLILLGSQGRPKFIGPPGWGRRLPTLWQLVEPGRCQAAC